MTNDDYKKIDQYMQKCMDEKDIAHDFHHIYRVLENAKSLIGDYDVDEDVLTAACLLHDIARPIEFKDKDVDHALLGSEMAYDFLLTIGWPHQKADLVRKCIACHRGGCKRIDMSLEARLLFDGDKLDLIGPIGLARIIVFASHHGMRLQLEGQTLLKELDLDVEVFLNKFYTKEAKEEALPKLLISKTYFDDLKKALAK